MSSKGSTRRKPSALLLLALTFTTFLLGQTSGTEWKLPAEVLSQLEDMRSRALDWVMSQRTDDFGWAGDTDRVVTALATALDDWPQKNDVEARLSAKQLELELLAKLLSHGIDPITPVRTAHYALALNAVCKDPHDFYGHNLIGILEKHHADYEYPGYPETFGFSYSSLVTCLGGAHLHKHQIRHLIQITRDESHYHSTDTKAIALMALKCVQGVRNSETLNRHIREGLEALGSLQNLDGSFGNTHTTALAIQGLGLDEDSDMYWNGTTGILALASLQDPNGSFSNDLYATTDALLAVSTLINGVGVLKLRRNRCTSYTYHPFDTIFNITEGIVKENSTTTGQPPTSLGTQAGNTEAIREATPSSESVSLAQNQDVTQSPVLADGTGAAEEKEVTTGHLAPAAPLDPTLVTVKYFLWIGPDPPTAERHNLSIQVAPNTTFFRIMQRAAELDSAYEFSSTVWPNGHYVHTISGRREQPIGYSYWLLYRLPTDPDPNNPPPTTYVAPAGVDDLIVMDGDVYLFWFKKI